MKKRIINLTIGLTGLVISFLPQKAEAAWCKIQCVYGSCMATSWFGDVNCYCDADGRAVCEA